MYRACVVYYVSGPDPDIILPLDVPLARWVATAMDGASHDVYAFAIVFRTDILARYQRDDPRHAWRLC